MLAVDVRAFGDEHDLEVGVTLAFSNRERVLALGGRCFIISWVLVDIRNILG